MNKLTFLLLIAFSIKGNSQDLGRDTFQTDSIYRINNVKKRIQFSPGEASPSPNIIKYDRLGRISELISDENSGNAKYRIVRKYSKTGILVTEDYFYGSIEGEKTDFKYDSKKRISKMSTTYYDAKQKKEVKFSYEPHTELVKNYNSEGILTSEVMSQFETKNILKKETSSTISPSGIKSIGYINHYQNSFDRANRLVKTIFSQGKNVVQVIKYKYDKKGLLIEKRILMPNYPEMKYTYKYEYW